MNTLLRLVNPEQFFTWFLVEVSCYIVSPVSQKFLRTKHNSIIFFNWQLYRILMVCFSTVSQTATLPRITMPLGICLTTMPVPADTCFLDRFKYTTGCYSIRWVLNTSSLQYKSYKSQMTSLKRRDCWKGKKTEISCLNCKVKRQNYNSHY